MIAMTPTRSIGLPSGSTSRSVRCIPVILLAALSIVMLPACSQPKPMPMPPDERIPVTVAIAQIRDMPLQVRVIGSVKAIATVAIRAQVGGQLTQVHFREGQDVRKGQPLFSIDSRPFQSALASAQANLARDQAQLRNSESEAARYAGLVKKDYVTREEYEKITTGAEAAHAVVAADRAAIDNARLQLAYCDIRSPIDGRTGSLQVQAGNLIKPNDTTPLVTILQIAPVYTDFSVPESQLGDLRARGLGNVPVTATPQGGGKTVDDGRLTFVDNSVDTATGTIHLKATFPNQDRALWPGQFVNVAMTLSSRANAVLIPSQAIQAGQKGLYVYIVKEGGSVEMRPVSVFRTIDQESIIEQGVSAGESVVTDGQLRLSPKSKVDIKGRA